jgi:hypothetical protein
MRGRFAPLAAIVPLLGLVACNGPDRSYAYGQATSIEGDTSAVINLAAHGASIAIPEGSASSAHVQLIAKDGEKISGYLQVVDPTILSMQTATNDPQRYVFLGLKGGGTALTISVNGVVAATIPATVIPAPAFTPPPWLTAIDTPDAGADDAGVDAATEGGGSEDAGSTDAAPPSDADSDAPG